MYIFDHRACAELILLKKNIYTFDHCAYKEKYIVLIIAHCAHVYISQI